MVNHDDGGGTAPHPLVWSAGALPKRLRLVHAVRDRAFLPGQPDIWISEWIALLAAPVKWVSFLGSFHWPAARADLGVGGVSFVGMNVGQVRGLSSKKLSPGTGGLGAQFQCRLL